MCIKFDGDLQWLSKQLNSEDMEFYIKHMLAELQNGYKSYAKSFIYNFGIVEYKNEEYDNLTLFKLLHVSFITLLMLFSL